MLSAAVAKEANEIILAATQALNPRRAEAKKTAPQNGAPASPRSRRAPRRPLVEYLDKFAGLPVSSREIVHPAKV